jgi:hypothetical protein
MADKSSDSALTNDITNFSYVATFGWPLVVARPKNINIETIRALLDAGEKVLSWGTLSKSTYFAFDEFLLRLIFLGLSLVVFAYSLMPYLVHFYKDAPWLNAYDWIWYPLGAFFMWLCSSRVQKATYVLTNHRLMRIGQFMHVFELGTFDRALRHQGPSGTIFVELWTKNGEAPTVVLELGQEPQAILAIFPLAIESDGKTPALPPALPAELPPALPAELPPVPGRD